MIGKEEQAGSPAVEGAFDEGRAHLLAWEREAPDNAFLADINLRRVLRYHLDEGLDLRWDLLERAGELSAGPMDRLARESNRDESLPRVERFSALGERAEAVVHHPSYRELGALVWSTAVLEVLGEPGNNVLCGALTYLIARNGEAGHTCPVACTAGLIKLLLAAGTDEQKADLLPKLTDTDFGSKLHASQFVTEVQGGSDVGANACRAEPDEATGRYRIFGEKWFCSVADAGIFVVSARVPDGGDGTSGLGLFLVPRYLDGRVNEFALRRLKTKLGTRSMPTAEIDFFGALAEPIGALGDGFRNLVGIVLDTSRVFNAVAACGIIARAKDDALRYGRYRRAFGQPIGQFPSMKEIACTLKTMDAAAMATTMRILHTSDLLDRGEGGDDLRVARRIQVMINKYYTALLSTRAARWGIEVLGDNGTIEDFSVMPRLLRDAVVVESWEGSHNTLCAQVLRDFAVRGMAKPWLAHHRELLDRVSEKAMGAHKARAAELLAEVEQRITAMLSSSPQQASLAIRHVIDRMCTLSAYINLQLECAFEMGQKEDTEKPLIIEYFRLTEVDKVDPLDEESYFDLVQKLAG